MSAEAAPHLRLWPRPRFPPARYLTIIPPTGVRIKIMEAHGRLALRGATYEVQVRSRGGHLTLQLEDCASRQYWTGTFAANCACTNRCGSRGAEANANATTLPPGAHHPSSPAERLHPPLGTR